MILSAHIAEIDKVKALKAYQAAPDPAMIPGLRYANTFMTAELRKGILPSLNTTGVALICAWDDDEPLDRFLNHPLAGPYADGYRVRMRPVRSIGELPGLPDLPRREEATGDQPVAALTVGTVRASKFFQFVKAAGAAEREAAGHPGFLQGVTIMRPPFVISTFSVWRNVREMRNYVVGKYPGGHLRAMRQAEEHGFHHEMSFSRYLPYSAEGQWKGSNPLAGLIGADVAVSKGAAL